MAETEISQLEDKLEAMAKEIQFMNTKYDTLLDLYNKINESTAFSTKEKELIKAKVDSFELERTEKTVIFKEKVNFFESKIRQVHNTINERTKIIDCAMKLMDDEGLECHDVMEVFRAKQSSLKNDLKKSLAQIEL